MKRLTPCALALALGFLVGGCSVSAPTAWEGTTALVEQRAVYQPQAYQVDAIIRTHDLFTQGPVLHPRALDDREVEAIRDAFLAALGKGRWLNGEDLATLTNSERLEQWRQVLMGTNLTLLEETGALVRQRQQLWRQIHGPDAAGPSVGMTLPQANHWKEAFGTWQPETGAALVVLTMDQTVQTLLSVWAERFDAHTALVPPEVSQTYIEAATGIAEGVGLSLLAKDQHLVVQDLISGGPASLSGLVRTGDVLLAARADRGEWVPTSNVLDTLAFFRQPAATFELRLERNGQPLTVRLIPAPYANNADALRVFRETLPTSQGAVSALRLEIRFFYEGSEAGRTLVEDVSQAIAQARSSGQPPQLVILDMRQARGGAIPQALAFTALFANGGSMGSVRSNDGRFQPLPLPAQPLAWEGPLQVWVGPLTASSAELASQAVADRTGAAVVGWPTYGKGTLQRRVELDMESARRGQASRLGELWMTVGELYGPSGRSLQQKGVALQWALPNPVPEPWGERGLPRALPASTAVTGSAAAPVATPVGEATIQPALADAQGLKALRAAAGQVWERSQAAAVR